MIIYGIPRAKSVADFEVINEFFYFGLQVTDNVECENIISIAWNSTARLIKIWKDIALFENNKLKFISVYSSF